jgi:hypothetical protein
MALAADNFWEITFFVPLPLVKIGIGVRLVDSEDAVDGVGWMAA